AAIRSEAARKVKTTLRSTSTPAAAARYIHGKTNESGSRIGRESALAVGTGVSFQSMRAIMRWGEGFKWGLGSFAFYAHCGAVRARRDGCTREATGTDRPADRAALLEWHPRGVRAIC